jgi:hypothetical protein
MYLNQENLCQKKNKIEKQKDAVFQMNKVKVIK